MTVMSMLMLGKQLSGDSSAVTAMHDKRPATQVGTGVAIHHLSAGQALTTMGERFTATQATRSSADSEILTVATAFFVRNRRAWSRADESSDLHVLE
jgi:hypothetical protein